MADVTSLISNQNETIERLILPTIIGSQGNSPSLVAYPGSLAYDPATNNMVLGSNGNTSSWSQAGALGAAQFINTTTQTVNAGAPFTFSTSVFNNTNYIVASSGGGGTVFTLSAGGTYCIDYEMSMSASNSLAIWKGASVGTIAIDTNTISGSTTFTTWVHGRCFETVTNGSPLVIALSPATGNVTVTSAGSASQFMARLTIMKIA